MYWVKTNLAPRKLVDMSRNRDNPVPSAKQLRGMTYSADGKHLVTITTNSISYWYAATGEQAVTSSFPSTSGLAFSPAGDQLAIVGRGGLANVYAWPQAGAPVRT